MTRVRQIFVDGRCVMVSDLHIEIAKLIYSRRPYVWRQTYSGPDLAPWDDAPASYQIEFLELAHAVLAHPAFAAGGAGQAQG
jgi:hypothetical protein